MHLASVTNWTEESLKIDDDNTLNLIFVFSEILLGFFVFEIKNYIKVPYNNHV